MCVTSLRAWQSPPTDPKADAPSIPGPAPYPSSVAEVRALRSGRPPRGKPAEVSVTNGPGFGEVLYQLAVGNRMYSERPNSRPRRGPKSRKPGSTLSRRPGSRLGSTFSASPRRWRCQSGAVPDCLERARLERPNQRVDRLWLRTAADPNIDPANLQLDSISLTRRRTRRRVLNRHRRPRVLPSLGADPGGTTEQPAVQPRVCGEPHRRAVLGNMSGGSAPRVRGARR